MKLYKIYKTVYNNISKDDFLINAVSSKSQENHVSHLIHLLNEGKVKSDSEIDKLISDKFGRAYCFRLKAKLRNQLLLNILHLNLNNPKFNKYTAIEEKCKIKLLQASLLLKMGLSNEGIAHLKAVIEMAEPFKYSNILKECYKKLRNSQVLKGNNTDYEYYNRKFKEYKKIEDLEEEVEILWYDIRLRGQKSVRGVKETRHSIDIAINNIQKIMSDVDSPKINQAFHYLKTSQFLNKADWNGNIKYCDDILDKMNKSPELYFFVLRNVVYVSKAYALIMTGRIKEGIKFVESVLPNYRGEEDSYFNIMEDYLILKLRASDFQGASNLSDEIINNPNFEQLVNFTRERWGIYRAYSKFFNNEEVDDEILAVNKFPEYSRDKEGFNLHLLFLQILIILKRGDTELLFQRIDNLKYYRIRQISKSGNRRVQYFMRMLFHLETYSMDYEKCKVQGNKYYNLLLQFPEKDQPYTEVELIPYEQLWQHILGMLKSRSRKGAIQAEAEQVEMSS